MAGGQAAARDVVDDGVRHAAGGDVHGDQRQPGLPEGGELRRAQRQGHDDHAVGPVPGHEGGQDMIALAGRVTLQTIVSYS